MSLGKRFSFCEYIELRSWKCIGNLNHVPKTSYQQNAPAKISYSKLLTSTRCFNRIVESFLFKNRLFSRSIPETFLAGKLRIVLHRGHCSFHHKEPGSMLAGNTVELFRSGSNHSARCLQLCKRARSTCELIMPRYLFLCHHI